MLTRVLFLALTLCLCAPTLKADCDCKEGYTPYQSWSYYPDTVEVDPCDDGNSKERWEYLLAYAQAIAAFQECRNSAPVDDCGCVLTQWMIVCQENLEAALKTAESNYHKATGCGPGVG